MNEQETDAAAWQHVAMAAQPPNGSTALSVYNVSILPLLSMSKQNDMPDHACSMTHQYDTDSMIACARVKLKILMNI